ncbi:biotin--[acetyl-CoA-carboxylase] ligase [Halomonas halocynthiae]|uniref:biotin--[acetyl-CoA-carboxylase] ligase n=1 Tax=Halomonas halocynthiae TaxID=176290 RepID=UPI00041A8D4A|nr:biotin--[acetyl-CoA-carboxylase] ligase [Halomonas halocynthiae]
MTIGDLIRLLSDGELHSGQQLGERLGVSRAAVWKQLRKLESLGIELVSVRGRGYRLARPLELLDGAALVSKLSRDSRRHLQRLIVEDSLPSSNEYLRQRFMQGAGHGEVCLVEYQETGRGRRGRRWSAPWGGAVMLSTGWRFEAGVASLEGLSLAVGVVLAQVLERHAVRPFLKWPNDVLLAMADGSFAKLAGILVEVSGDVAGPCEAVIGLGINVDFSAAFRGDIEQSVATVHDQSPALSRNVLAADVIDSLLPLLAGFEKSGFAPWQDAWNARHGFAGLPVEVIRGKQRLSAIAESADTAGNLWVRHAGGRERLAGGEVSLRRRL